MTEKTNENAVNELLEKTGINEPEKTKLKEAFNKLFETKSSVDSLKEGKMPVAEMSDLEEALHDTLSSLVILVFARAQNRLTVEEAEQQLQKLGL